MDINEEAGYISGEYSANNLELKEIIRLNPESMQIIGQKIYPTAKDSNDNNNYNNKQ